jgi:hypothetical protein
MLTGDRQLCRDDRRLKGGGELLRLCQTEPKAGQTDLLTRSMRATSTSVVSPARNSVTSLTRHTSFAISSASSRERDRPLIGGS